MTIKSIADERWRQAQSPAAAAGETGKRAFRFRTGQDLLQNYTPAAFTVAKLIPELSVGVIFGPPASSKSLIVQGMAVAIATGSDFFDMPTRHGAVFYICGEGLPGIRKRLKALAVEYDYDLTDAPLFVSESASALNDETQFRELVRAMAAETEQAEVPVSLIVIDTLSRNFGPGSESLPEDMSLFVTRLDQLRDQFRATVIVVHHKGHANDRSRGSTVLPAAADFEYQVTREDDRVILRNTKAKDIDIPDPVSFSIVPVSLPWRRADGDGETSAVLKRTDFIPSSKATGMGPNQRAAMKVLRDLHQSRAANTPGVDPRITAEEFGEMVVEEDIVSRKKWYELRKSLERAGRITISSGIVYMTDTPE